MSEREEGIMEYTLERDDKGPVVFDGHRLAELTTYTRGKLRWTELALYSVTPRRVETVTRWVVQSVGKTRVEGEREFHTVTLCATPEDVAEALSRDGKLSGPGFDLIDAAAELDDELDVYMDKIMETEEVL